MQNHNPPTVWTVPEPFRTIYAHAREVPAGTRQLHVSGQFGVAPDGAMRPDFAGQLDQAMDNVEALLASAGMGEADVAKATFFLTRTQDLPALGEARRRRWASDAPAAVTVVVVAALARSDALVEVEVTGARRDEARAMDDATSGLRRATPADAAVVRELTRAAYAKWVPVIGREPRPMTADYDAAVRDHLVDLLHVDGELAALIEMAPGADHLLIVNVAVAPGFQGQGHGRALMAHAEEVARSLGLGEVRLYTNGRFTENLRLYRRLGYGVDREEEHPQFGMTVYMSKRLSTDDANRPLVA